MLSLCLFRKRFHTDSGSIVPLLAVVFLLVLMMGALLGATVQKHRRAATAQWAADAVALAVASGGTDKAGQSVAVELAAANGAELRSIRFAPPSASERERFVSMVVVVEVEYQGTVAIAAAARVMMATNGPSLGPPSTLIGQRSG